MKVISQFLIDVIIKLFRQAPIGDDNYLHLAARAGFDGQLAKRAYTESDGLNQRCIDAGYNYDGLTRRIEDRRYVVDESLRKCLDSDSINRRYENNDNNTTTMIRYESNSETMRSIQNDLNKFDRSLSNTLRSDRSLERNGNENMENHRRMDVVGINLLTSEGVSLSDSLSRKLSNYDNTRKQINNEGTLTRRIRDDVSDISSSSMSGRGNH